MEVIEQKNENITLDDKLLIRRCVTGDNSAMGVLITKYQDRVYNVILKICQNSDDALELTQDTFVKVIENIGSFKGTSKLFTWIYRIAVNLTLNYCQRKVKLKTGSLDSQPSDSSQTKAGLRVFLADDSSADPSDVVEENELIVIADQAVKALTEDQRAIVVLRDIEDLSYAQIAHILDVELGTVKSRLSRARDALRRVFKAMAE